MIVKLLTEYHLEFLSLTGGCRGSSESTLVKMSNDVLGVCTPWGTVLVLSEERTALSSKSLVKNPLSGKKGLLLDTHIICHLVEHIDGL